MVDTDQRQVLGARQARLADGADRPNGGAVADGDDRRRSVGLIEDRFHLPVPFLRVFGSGRRHPALWQRQTRFGKCSQTAAQPVDQAAVLGWTTQHCDLAVAKRKQMAGDGVAGSKVVAQNARQPMPLDMIFDQHQRNGRIFQLDDHLRRDVPVVGNNQPAHLLRQIRAQRIQPFGLSVVHVEQHLVAQPLRLGLEPPDHIAVEDVEQRMHRPLFDQQPDRVGRRGSCGRKRHFVAQLGSRITHP